MADHAAPPAAKGPAAAGTAGSMSRKVAITNQRGLHARAAARFVKLAEQFHATISVVRNDVQVSGLSIMGLMMLAAGPGSDVEIRAEGSDAEVALEALTALVENGFDETT
ncbi:MAG: HPr family phosphocarrier protein [Rhodospirillales bacterium]